MSVAGHVLQRLEATRAELPGSALLPVFTRALAQSAVATQSPAHQEEDCDWYRGN